MEFITLRYCIWKWCVKRFANWSENSVEKTRKKLLLKGNYRGWKVGNLEERAI